MNHAAILVVARSYALPELSDSSNASPVPVANFYALPWSRRVYDFFTKRHPCWCCVWLFAGAARSELLGEFSRLGIPLTLVIQEGTAQMYRATNLMAQYPNICGIAFEPFDNKQCENLMAKMRNAATARRFWDAVESKLFPETQPTTALDYGDALYAEAQNQYTDICYMDAENRLVPQTLGSLLRQIEAQTPFGTTPPLIRIHDKYAVNPAQVRDVRPTESRRDHILTLSNGKELPLSRTYKRNLTRLPVKVPRSRGGGGEHPAEKANKFSGVQFSHSDVLLNNSDVLLNSA